MKKTLVALAALAAATGAFAQSPNARAISGSGVEIFGVVDLTISQHTGDKMGGQTAMSGDGRNESSRLGFRGVEDIGGGWGAGFWLEAGAFFDSGAGQNTSSNNTAAGDKMLFGSTAAVPYSPSATAGPRQGLTFNRASVVSLLHRDMGEIRVGRDYNPSFWNYTTYDPFGTVGSGSAMLVIGGTLAPAGAQLPPGAAYPMVRTSNSVGWLSNNMGGFRAQLQIGLSEQFNGCTTAYTSGYAAEGNGQTSNGCLGASGDGKLTAGRLSYASGPFTAAAAFSKTSYTDNGFTAATATTISTLANTTNYKGDLTIMNFGGSYQVNSALRLVGSLGSQELTATVATPLRKLNHSTIGALYTQGAMTYKISYNQAARTDGSTLSTSAAVANADGTKQTQVAIGAVYDLSKRTALYGTWANQTTTAGAGNATGLTAGIAGFSGMFSQVLAANGKATTSGVDIGIRHRF